MDLAQLNAEERMKQRHDTQRTAHLVIAIDTLTAAWNGEFDRDDFIQALQRTAERLTTLAKETQHPGPQ